METLFVHAMETLGLRMRSCIFQGGLITAVLRASIFGIEVELALSLIPEEVPLARSMS